MYFSILRAPIARDYVDVLDTLLTEEGHIFKGEDSDESLEGLSDAVIEEKLRQRMFDSTVTIVLISKNMVVAGKPEKHQWMPREISYSLKQKTRDDRTSYHNGCIAVVLPDENGNYNYLIQDNGCCTRWHTNTLFPVLGRHMFNLKQQNKRNCGNGHGELHTDSNHSYIYPVKWSQFVENITGHVDYAKALADSMHNYKMQVNL